MAFPVVNPATGETVREVPQMRAAAVRRAIERADRAAAAWGERAVADRAPPMRAVARLLRARADELARLMAVEMGKPVRQGRAEVEKCAWVAEYYAEHAAGFLADEVVATDASRSYVTCRPLGVVLAIMPWNFPLWQVFRFAAPALMAGNGVLLKHAANVPGCALAIEALFRDAGFPSDLFATLLITPRQATGVIRHPLVRAVTLTGSTGAGRAVAARAGEALKKTVLELGGSDPYLVLDDADVAAAAAVCAESRLINSGQSCIAAKRFLVVPAVREAFEARLVERMRAAVMGDPLAETTDVGPQARRDLRDALHRQVTASVGQGARLRLGGEVPAGPGAFYPPTVLTDVRLGMPAADEELFGPVAAVLPVADEDEAVRVANASDFGLGAAVFTRDLARGEWIARTRLAAGACVVNGLVRSDPRLPFGGIKQSGYGRELGAAGIREFVNLKTVVVR